MVILQIPNINKRSSFGKAAFPANNTLVIRNCNLILKDKVEPPNNINSKESKDNLKQCIFCWFCHDL